MGHLLIEQVQDGSIVVKDRQQTVTLVAERTPKKSLIKGETTSTTTLPGASASITSSVSGAGQSVVSVVEKKTTAFPVDRRRLSPADNTEQDSNAALANFINQLKAEQTGAGTGEGGSSEAEKAALKEAIADLEAMRITTEEANRLDDLGKKLKQVQSDPNRAGNSKVQRSRGPQTPGRPPQLSRRPPR